VGQKAKCGHVRAMSACPPKATELLSALHMTYRHIDGVDTASKRSRGVQSRLAMSRSSVGHLASHHHAKRFEGYVELILPVGLFKFNHSACGPTPRSRCRRPALRSRFAAEPHSTALSG